MLVSDEEAKAIQETAKTTSKALDVVGKSGSYVGGIFRGPLEAYSRLQTDRIEHQRALNLLSYIAKQKEAIERLGLTETFDRLSERSVPLLVEAVANEPAEELQDVWAAYVANAMDPDQPVATLNRQLITVIQNLEPGDLAIFERLSRDWSEEATVPRIVLKESDFPVPVTSLQATLARLSGLGLFNFIGANEALWGVSQDAKEFMNIEIHLKNRGRFRPTPLFGLFHQSVWGKKPAA